jgi:hypothetical protein
LSAISVILQVVYPIGTETTAKVAGIGVGSLSVLSLGIGVVLLSASSLVTTMTPITPANSAKTAAR